MNTSNEFRPFIRKALMTDHASITDFQMRMALETETLYLDRTTVEKGVLAALADASKARYFVAQAGKQVIASMMITYEWSDWRNGVVWWIQSVYIEPAFRGKKVFSLMYTYLKHEVEHNDGVLGLRLYVDQKNLHARKVYASLGMNGDHYATYEWMK